MQVERQHLLRWGGLSGMLAAGILVVMAVVGLATGPASSQLLRPTDPALLADLLARYGGTVQVSILLDDLFVLAYTGGFLALAALVWPRSRWLAAMAMVWALATAFFDFNENARLLILAQGVGGSTEVTVSAVRELALIGQLKYSCSHLATFLFALGLPRWDRLSWTVTVLLFLFPVASTLAFAVELAGLARLLLMGLLLALGGWLAWKRSQE
jgi:hypothetical protein